MTFERSKNIKAISWTAGIHVLLLVLFLVLKYTLPAQPKNDDFSMEVNLGTSDNGYGNDQPEIPEDPAPPEAAIAPATATKTGESNTKEILTSDDKDAAGVVSKPKTTDKKTVTINDKEKKNKSKAVTQNTTQQKKQAVAEKPKYTYPGSNGKGGNSASNSHAGGNEGIGAGDGDMGVPGGTPGAKNYVGIAVRLGNRKMVARPDPNATFNEGGNVVINVTVNREGNIVNYRIKSAANATLRRLAEQKIKSVRFNKAPDAPVEQFGDITFIFKATRK